jgi:hypothetical protein
MKTTYHLTHKQLLWVSLFFLGIGLSAIYFLNTAYFNARQLNAAGINSQAMTVMLHRGETLVAASDKAIAEIKNTVQPEMPTQIKAVEPATKSLWQTAGNKSGTPTIPLSDKITAYQIIEVDTNPATYPLIGQQINLSLLNGNKVSAKVEAIQVHPNGDYSLRGHLTGYGNDYPITMTYGEQHVFATITTPEGSYSMESLNGLGWLYKNPAEPELTTPGNNDFVEPPQD